MSEEGKLSNRWIRRLLSVPVRWKLMGEAVGIVVLFAVATTIQIRTVLRDSLREELKRRAALVAATLSEELAKPLAANRFDQAKQLVDRRVSLDRDISYVEVVDATGRELFAVRNVPDSPTLKKNETIVDHSGGATLRFLKIHSNGLWDASVPIVLPNSAPAELHVGLSEARLQQTLASTTKQLILVAALVSLVGLAWAVLLNLAVVRPIDDLLKAIEAVRAGNWNYRAKLWANDELGQLAAGFNRMTEALARSQQELQDSNEKLRRRNAELSAVNSILQAATSSLELSHVLDKTLKKVAEMQQADAGWIFVEDPQNGQFATQTSLRIPPDNLRRIAQQVEQCRRTHLEHVESVRVLTGEQCCPGVDCSAIRQAGLLTHLCVPLHARERPVGVLSLAFRERREIPEADLHLLRIIGHQIAVAVENAFLYEQVRQQELARRRRLDEVIQAQEEERKRIARELHDQVAQSLTALLMAVDAVRMTLPPELAQARTQLEQVHELAVDILEELRRLMMNLRPAMLDDLGLIAAVKSYAENKLPPLGIQPTVQVFGRRRKLPAPVDIAVYRIIQEGVNNIAKHSEAKHATIVIEYYSDKLTLIIEDDGKGFKPEQVQKKTDSGLGLLGIQERVGLLSGRFRLTTSPGAGCRIDVEIPLTKEESGDGKISNFAG